MNYEKKLYPVYINFITIRKLKKYISNNFLSRCLSWWCYRGWNRSCRCRNTVYISNNSVIRKAILFVTTFNSSADNSFLNNSIEFNNNLLHLSKNDIITTFNSTVSNQLVRKGVIALDVTNLISPSQNSYTLIPSQNQSSTAKDGLYTEFYLYVAYQNSNLSKVNPVIFLNEKDNQPFMNYHINNINSINLTSEVAFTFHATEFCDTLRDGSYVSINGNLIGLTGGNELPPNRNCTGVWGSFYYYNGTVFGLANDVPNNTMSGADALANIQPYLNNSNSIDIKFEYQDPTHGPLSNSVMQLFLTYSTPCDTFFAQIPNDTTICHGETLQLNTTGGQAYEWAAISDSSAIDDISCTDCPNPIFSGDSSTTYTVRI